MSNYYHHGCLLDVFSKTTGLEVPDESPRIYYGNDVRQAVDELKLPEQFIAFHCQSNQPERDWQKERWNALANRINRETGICVLEVGLQPVLEQAGEIINLCGKVSLLETAEVIRRACLFIGIDSGPAHLANAVGTPGVILLGHFRDYKRYIPYSGAYRSGENARVINADGAAAILSVDPVFQAVQEELHQQERNHCLAH